MSIRDLFGIGFDNFSPADSSKSMNNAAEQVVTKEAKVEITHVDGKEVRTVYVKEHGQWFYFGSL